MKGYNFKPKANEDKRIVKFLDMQGNFADTFRYLIEKEIAENGVRDLSLFIPSKRNIDVMRENLGISNEKFIEQEMKILDDESIIIQKKEQRSNKRNTDIVDENDKEIILNKPNSEKSNIENHVEEANTNNEDPEEIPGQINVDEFIKINTSIEKMEDKNNIKDEISISSGSDEIEEDEENEIPECYR